MNQPLFSEFAPEFAMNFGKRIKQAREACNWTAVELAARSGVAHATIGALENRDSKRSEYSEQLIAAFPEKRVSHTWLRTGIGSMDAPSGANGYPAIPLNHWRMVANSLAVELAGQRVDPSAFLALADLLAEAIPAGTPANEVTNTARRHLRLVA